MLYYDEICLQRFHIFLLEAVIKQNADEEKKSVWLFDLLDLIGMNEEYRSKTQRAYRMLEIIYTFLDPDFSWYLVGSRAEGIFAPGDNFFYYCKRWIWFAHAKVVLITRTGQNAKEKKKTYVCCLCYLSNNDNNTYK